MAKMQFLITAYDGENQLEKRMEVRPRHLANLPKDHVICAGGLLTEDTGKMKGSAMIMEFENRAALNAYLATEPYVIEHVWERITVEQINVVIGRGH